MSKPFYLLVTALLIVCLFRFYSLNGNFESQTPPELEEAGELFAPIRESMREKANELLPQPQAALLAGMVLGVKEDLPPEFKLVLRNTATLHIVVVSGQNLTLLCGFLISFAFLFGRKKITLFALGIVLFYSILTGLQVPVVRAAIMVFLATVARLFGREGDSLKIILLTVLGMLSYNPSWLFSVSFQLSVLATIGVAVVAPRVLELVKKAPEFLKEDFVVSTCAQLMVLPVIAINFHQLSLSGILVNGLILWTVPLIMVVGAIGLMVSYLNFMLGWLVLLLPYFLLTFFVYVVQFFSQITPLIYIKSLHPLVWIGYYLILFGFLWLLSKKRDLSNLDDYSSKL